MPGNVFGLILKNKMAARDVYSTLSKDFCWPSRAKGIIGRNLKFAGYVPHYKILTGNIFGLILKNKMVATGVFLSVMKSAYYLPPAAEGRCWEIIKHLPYVRTSVRLSHFCINLNISFIYKDIFTKFPGNVYGYENLSLQNFSLTWKNKMAAVANCVKIIKML